MGAQLWERRGPQAPFMVTAFAALLEIIPVWLKFKLPKEGNGEAIIEAQEL
jgi:hypothetical protein